jgi:hypothetical protein
MVVAGQKPQGTRPASLAWHRYKLSFSTLFFDVHFAYRTNEVLVRHLSGNPTYQAAKYAIRLDVLALTNYVSAENDLARL